MSKRRIDSINSGPGSSRARVEESATTAPLATRMQTLLFKEEGADVHFVVGDPGKGNVERIPAVVIIVCAASDVFKVMFYGSFECPKEVAVPDADPKAFKIFLRYIYTDEMLLNMEDAIGVLYLAKKYMLKPLVDGTARYIAEHLTPQNVCLFLDCADVLDDIKNKCWDIIDSQTVKVMRSEAFLQLSQAQLGDIAKRDTLCVAEIELYEWVVQWACTQLERAQEDPTPAAIRGALGVVLFSIRFPVMGAADFSREVSKSGVLTAEEVVEVRLWRAIRHKPKSFSCKPRFGDQSSPFPDAADYASSIPDYYLMHGGWCTFDLWVTVRRTYDDEELHGQTGVVIHTTDTPGDVFDVYFYTLDVGRSIEREYLLPVKPHVDDEARVIYGEEGVGLSGKVISMDGPEAVIKLASGVRLIPLDFLCKLQA